MFSSQNSQVSNDANYIEDVFSTYLYTGNDSTQTINNGIDLSGKGGLVWVKSRSNAYPSGLNDSARGVNKQLISSQTIAEYNNTISGTTYGISAFNSNGFSLNGDYPYNGSCNSSGATYVSWTFRKQPKFFDVVTFVGTGANLAVNHNLGSVPGCIIIKNLDAARSWQVYHRSVGNTAALQLNATSAAGVSNVYWNDTTPTSTQFTIGTQNEVGNNYVAYLFAHDAGGFGLTGTDNVISCGSFTTDSGGNFSEVNLGYEPQWLLIKNATTALGFTDWRIVDNMRGFTTSTDTYLAPNTSAAEGTAGIARPTATGFAQDPSSNIREDTTYIYIAIRRGPMKVPTDATKVYNAISRTGTGATANVTGVGFPPDMLLDTMRSTSWTRSMWDRLRGPNLRIATNQTSAETSYTDAVMAYGQDGVTLGADGNVDVNGSGYTYINWFFRRAPSFFDEVCYTGTGVNGRAISHNLGVAPELAIVKSRNNPDQWWVFSSAFAQPADNYFILNGTLAVLTATGYGFTTTSTTFTPSPIDATTANASGFTYVAYLFATCAGVSKVGSYTGDGTVGRVIDCGFTSGARFVMFKRTSTTSDWYVYDTARGIVAGDEKSLSLNTTAAESGSGDFIDLDNSGFVVGTAATDYFNESGVSFIFLAIA